MAKVRILLVAGGLAGAFLSACGCARLHAKAEPEQPPALETPAPPPRVITPIEAEPIAPAVEEAPNRHPVRSVTKPANQRNDTVKSEPPKAEPKPETPTPPTAKVDIPPEPPRATEEAQPPQRRLQAGRPATSSEAEKNIRDVLGRASRDLNRVDYGALTEEGKTQYNAAKRFLQQADEALRVKNFIFAANLADKAAALAAILLGR
jgi:hypothetical protein